MHPLPGEYPGTREGGSAASSFLAVRIHEVGILRMTRIRYLWRKLRFDDEEEHRAMWRCPAHPRPAGVFGVAAWHRFRYGGCRQHGARQPR